MNFPPTPSSSMMGSKPQRTRSLSLSSTDGVRRKSSSTDDGPIVIQNAVALMLIGALHRWCCQLFYLTFICIAHCCGNNNDGENRPFTIAGKNAEEKRANAFKEVRRSIMSANKSSQRRTKNVTDLEENVIKVLRQLTCPENAVLHAIRIRELPRRRRHHPLSRAPSPKLFDIDESDESE